MAKGNSTNDKATEAIRKAMSQAIGTSGAGGLPTADAVPEAWSPGRAVGNDSTTAKGHALLELPAGATIAREQEIMSNPLAQSIAPEQVMMSKMMADALQKQAPAPPPVQVAFGQGQTVVPPDLLSAPYQLHITNQPMSKALWSAFCGEYRKILSQLAAKSGYASTPFLYLNQAIFTLIRIKFWMPKVDSSCAPFDPEHKNQSSDFYKGLIKWMGFNQTRELLVLCESHKINVMDCLRQMYRKLEDDRLETVGAAAKYQTAYEWSGEDEEDA